MKKIIAAFDGLKYSESTETYALNIAEQTGALLVGVFLEDFTYHSYKLFDMVGSQGVSQEKVKQLMSEDKAKRRQAVQKFKTSSEERKIKFSIHTDKSVALQELLKETIYCDLLVICVDETLTHYPEEPPTLFIRDLLADVQCPVLLVPTQFKPMGKIVLLYDGEPSSVYASKVFSYMFPWCMDFETEVVMVRTEKNPHLPDYDLIKEFIRCHFPKSSFIMLEGDPELEITNYLKTSENALVVLGAYRRSMVSRWFNPSMADALMKNIELPFFIAHNR